MFAAGDFEQIQIGVTVNTLSDQLKEYFGVKDGVLVTAQGNDAGDMTITVPTVGQTVPVKQSGSYSVTLTTPH